MHIHLSLSKIPHLYTKKTKPGKVSHFFSGTKAKRKHVTRYDVVMSKLNCYDQELFDLDEDLPEWWKSRQVQYPLMSQLC